MHVVSIADQEAVARSCHAIAEGDIDEGVGRNEAADQRRHAIGDARRGTVRRVGIAFLGVVANAATPHRQDARGAQ